MNKTYKLAALTAMLAMAAGENKVFGDIDEDMQKFSCKECRYYQKGKTYCKVAKHHITSNTNANKCRHLQLIKNKTHESK